MKKLIVILIVAFSLSACAMFDSEAPIINLTKGEEIQVEHGSVLDMENYISVTDNYSEDIVIDFDGIPETDELGASEVTVKARDEKGNEATATVIVTVIDTESPLIQMIGEEVLELNYRDTYEELGVKVTDNADDKVGFTINGEVVNGEIGEYLIVYESVDSSGNTSSLTRTVHIKDLTSPEITLNGESTVMLTLGETYDDEGAVSIDEIDNDCEVVVAESINYMKAGIYEITYNSTDKSGNKTVAKRDIVIEPLSFKTIKDIEARLKALILVKDEKDPETWAKASLEVTNNKDSDYNNDPVFWFTNNNGDQINFSIYSMGQIGTVRPGGTVVASYKFGCEAGTDLEQFYDTELIEFQFFPDDIIGKFPKKYSYDLRELYEKSSIKE